MSINTYAVVVSIEECPVRNAVFCVAVVRIKLPTPFTRQARVSWGFSLSESAKRQHTCILCGRKRVETCSSVKTAAILKNYLADVPPLLPSQLYWTNQCIV